MERRRTDRRRRRSYKLQQGSFFGTFADNYVDSTLTTWSITPRLSIKNDIFGLRSNILTGIDYYDAKYNSDRSKSNGLPQFMPTTCRRTVSCNKTIGILTTDFPMAPASRI
jgi:iron complex outermembrane receptor protein